MKKIKNTGLFFILIFSMHALHAMNPQKIDPTTLYSLGKKCISYCSRTIVANSNINKLRASKEISGFFTQQEQRYINLKQKIENTLNTQSNENLYNSIEEFITQSPGNIVLVPQMWPQQPTQQEMAIIKTMKDNEK